MTMHQEVIPLLRKGDYITIIDLTNTYLHVPMNKRYRKFLRSLAGKTHYQFMVLPFGIRSAPVTYTRAHEVSRYPRAVACVYVWLTLIDC